MPRRGRGRSREPVRLMRLVLRLSIRLQDLHTAAIFAEESTSEGLAIRLLVAARKLTFRRQSGPLGLETGTMQEDKVEQYMYAQAINRCKQARGQYCKVTGYDNMACDNNMRHVGMCIHIKGAYAYQPQGEGATDHWLLTSCGTISWANNLQHYLHPHATRATQRCTCLSQ